MKQEMYRHKRTGGIYSVICNAHIEKTGELVVVYRNVETDARWVRPAAEFNDGRFERIAWPNSAELTGARLSDAKLMRWLRDNLEWDGHGYWLPEICVMELQHGENKFHEPTLQEFRAFLSAKVNGS